MRKIIVSSLKLGIFQLLPLIILFIVCYFVLNLIVPFLIPTLQLFHLVQIFGTTLGIMIFAIVLLMLSFCVGVLVQTKIGNSIKNIIEKKLLINVPGYKMLVEVFEPLKGEKDVLRGDVALARIYDGSALTTVYVLKVELGMAKCIWVCGGNPGMILVMYVPIERITFVEKIKFHDSFKTLLSFGAGSKEILERYYEVKREANF